MKAPEDRYRVVLHPQSGSDRVAILDYQDKTVLLDGLDETTARRLASLLNLQDQQVALALEALQNADSELEESIESLKAVQVRLGKIADLLRR